jgi:hypothetical protein
MAKAKIVAGWLLASVLLMPSPALAYVGPGAGTTRLGALWGVLVAILLVLGAVLYLPIRTVLRKRGSDTYPQPTPPVEGGSSKGMP